MKKSLSVLVATAMVSSMFASVAFAADDELTTQQKLDELIAAGIFDKDGTGNGSELESHMTREQLAKILAKLKKLEEVSGTSYTDVAADRWSAGFIQAVSKVVPPLMDGVADGVFDPAGDVTLEQLATVAVRALNLQVKSDAEVEGEVSDWAKGYVATALENGLIGEKEDYTEPAIRSDLVETTYSAREILAKEEEPEKVSIKEAKAVGVQLVEVTLDKVIDTEKAQFTLKKGSSDVALDTTATKWSDDKKKVTLKLKDAKISQGTYTVTLGGIDAAEIDKASAEFTAENEKVTKIEFVSASDTIAKHDKARIRIQVTNQYGEAATVPAGNFTVYSTLGNATLSKSADGRMYVIVDTDVGNIIPNYSQFSVNIYSTDYQISASKTFKIGDAPYVTKVELGEVTYKNGKSALSAAGDTAVIQLTQYDQYGGEITADMNLQNAAKPYAFATSVTGVVESNPQVIDDNNDGIEDVVVKLKEKATKSEEVTVSVFAGGSTATAKVKVESSKVAAKVELIAPSGTLAKGDNDKYIELVAYDEAGNKLTADEIVDNAKEGRFKISASSNLFIGPSKDVPAAMLVNSNDNGEDNKIVAVGPNKGKIHIGEVVEKGQASISVSIFGFTTPSYSTLNLQLTDVRYPDSIKVATEGATKAVAGAKVKPKFQLIDNYGEKITDFSKAANEVDYIDIVHSNKRVTFDVYGVATTADPNFKVTVSGKTVTQAGTILGITDFSDKEVTIETLGAAAGASVEVKFTLRKLDKDTGDVIDSNVASITRKVTVISSEEAKNLTYSLNAIGDLFNTLDDDTYTTGDQENVTVSKLAKEVVVSAKDAAGNTVAFPKQITSVTTDTYSIAQGGTVEVLGTPNEYKGFVIGNKVGTANVTVGFRDATNQVRFVTGQVTVKNEPNRVESIAAGSSSKKFKPVDADGKHASALMGNLTVKNQYGNEFKSTGAGAEDIIGLYDKYLQIRYSITDVTGVTASLNSDNTVSVAGAEGSFVLTAVAPNGKIAVTTVVISDN